MRSAKDPGGGGLEEAGAGFRAVDAVDAVDALLGADLAAFGDGLGRGFAADVVADLADVGLPGAGLPDFEGRRSCSSAFRFVPVTTLFFSEES